MGFFLQLRMLLWKNFLIRKRQKIRCIAELIWPLFLFLILMWVRTRGLRTNIEQCYFTEKSMPSVGQFPFLQSFICTFNNTCHQTVKEAEVKTEHINATMSLSRNVIQFLNELLQNRERWIGPNSTLMFSGLQELANLGEKISKRQTAHNISERQTSLLGNTLHTKDLFKKPNNVFESLQINNVSLSKEVVGALLNSDIAVFSITMGQILAFQQNASSVLCNKEYMQSIILTKDIDAISSELCALPKNELNIFYDVIVKEMNANSNLKQLTQYIGQNLGANISWNEWLEIQQLHNQISKENDVLLMYSNVIRHFSDLRVYQNNSGNESSPFPEIFSIMTTLLCGNDSADFLQSNLDGQATRYDSISDQLEGKAKPKKYVYDNSTTEVCNNIFENLESSPFTRIIWKIFKPYIRGKILYTPQTPATKRLMDKLANVFYTVKLIQDSTYMFGNSTITFLSQELTNNTANLMFIKRLYDSPLGNALLNNTWLKQLLGSDYEADVAKAREDIDLFLNPNDTEYRIETFNRLAEINFNISSILECFYWDKVEPYSTENEAMEAGMALVEKNELWALVVFVDPGNETLNPLTTYKIRMSTDRIDDTASIQDSLARLGARRRPLIDLKYITFGFAYLQDLLDHFIIQEQSGFKEVPGIILQQFPYPCYISDQFIMAISRTFPLFMVLAWVYTCAMIVKSIVYEKEKRLKETMRVMGLGNGIHWLGWFIDSLVPMLITIAILTLILVEGGILRDADLSLIFCFLTIYGISTIALSFLISVFFDNANLSAASGGIIFFVLYLPYPFMVRWILYLSPEIKILMSLLSNTAFGLGASYFSLYEERGSGLRWADIWESPLYEDDFCLAYVMGMLVLDSFLYIILTWYIEAVFPGQYGIPKPWYFPVTRTYWLGRSRKRSLRESSDPLVVNDEAGSNNVGTFEEEPVGLICGVSIHQLGMKYNNDKVALSGLNLNFYENQITSFLGHNGAGKTTTISILTGLFPPTHGTAKIYGLDIRTDMDAIRNSLGMCPQHNVLFDLLSVEEHLWFYARLRGQRKENVLLEQQQMIKDLGLPHKRTTFSKDLSGGMQRKLSIAVAFIGGSKTVILDEPTSGVDPHSRRSIWELLIKYKKNRTVILTTHFMDEADLLGDRIAIIANGQLQTCGSSLFLKTHFGSGYHLSVAFQPVKIGAAHSRDVSSLVQDLNQFILNIMPSAKLLEQIGDEVTFVLPQNDNPETIVELLKSLEIEKENLSVHSYGISDTSLEDVFLKVADQGSVNRILHSGSKTYPWWKRLLRMLFFLKPKGKMTAEITPNQVSTVKAKKEIQVQRNGASLKYTTVPVEDDHEIITPSSNKNWRQFIALHIKRFQNTSRNKKAMFCELVIPALFVCLTLIMTSILPTMDERPPLPLSPWLYSAPRYMFFSNDNPSSPSVNKYVKEINGPIGIGTKCMIINGSRDSTCIGSFKIENFGSSNFTGISEFGLDCSCATGSQICPAGAGKPDPPNHKVVSDDTMYDLTGSNISEWLMKSHKRFARNRYGGYSLGVMSSVPNLIVTDVKTMASQSQTNNVDDNLQDGYSNNNIKVWFNNKGWAASVSYMNAINNVLLRAVMPPENADQYGINTINHPMNYTKQQINSELLEQGVVSLLHAIAVIFALSFVPASFTLFLIEERINGSKHLQLVSGVNRLIYWLQAFSWDMMCYFVSVTLCVFVFLIFNDQSYVSPTNFPGLIILLMLYGWSVIPLMYPASFLFTVPSSAFVSLACANMFIGIITTITTSVLQMFDDEELKSVSRVLEEVFLVLPQYCLGSGLLKMSASYYKTVSLSSFDIEIDVEIFSWGLLGKNLFSMFVAGLVYFLFTLGIEFGLIKKIFKPNQKIIEIPEPTAEEEDVHAERQRVIDGDTTRDVLVIKNLCKVYKSSASVKPATNHICVGVKKGECFGLLGLNGAGKTSTFKMLTGATMISKGDATVTGFSVKNDIDKVRSLIGYCPQFDALNPLLTTREHLELYARLRNIPSKKVQQAVDNALQKLNLGHYSDRCAGTLSGGNKRKLSTAIALLGDPPLVFLDEPTSGMDPKARRFLWTCIQDVVRDGRSVILTSHSMEECEALCTRLTIMVNGQFKCLGSSHHLKNKFGKGYSLVVRCKNECALDVKDYISKELPDAVLLEAHYNQLRYQLSMSNLKLDKVFSSMEAAKQAVIVEDYSLSQTTLEEVFIRFASEQSDAVKSKFGVLKHIRRAIAFKCSKCCVDAVGDERDDL